ncbi:hypothetical protein F3Y22_tig00116964pilonHSYRG00269 [Hibiscus syriacus]|uniref:Endonuclease/exonuclease/phosphatase domain-containing protein n=1 Tax=Hibiscus syriacus TaxID=106335 RepID=A0A6A2WJF9_HIBSY|nr:hypothetical protein F3Y22_tig00116964pilonHSYRG00269 [Hibiscus syriacus]
MVDLSGQGKEAVATFEVGKALGVVFASSRDVVIQRMKQNELSGLVNVYGTNHQSDRDEFFDLLSNAITNLNCPVIVGGDFNVVRSAAERIGASEQTTGSNLFEDFISKWELFEVPILVYSTKKIFGYNSVVLKERKQRKLIRPFKWFNHWADDPILFDRIKHGCPLSPLLFNVVEEALSGLLKKATAIGLCGGVGVGTGRLSNWAKSLNCGSASLPTIYLGILLGHNKNSKALWQPVIDKVKARLQSLKGVVNPRKSSWVWRYIVNPILFNEGNMFVDFSLALKQSGKIIEFGSWENGVWVWRIELRRNLFAWETSLWADFLMVLSRVVSSTPAPNRLSWGDAPNGWYTPKSFCSKLAAVGKVEDSI